MPPSSAAFIPSLITKSLICIDEIRDFEYVGKLFNPYKPAAMSFVSIKQLLDLMDGFYDEINFPQAIYTARDFYDKKISPKRRQAANIVRHHDDSLFEENRGVLSTFIIYVTHRRNASWQGELTWLENTDGAEARSFHSTLEMLRTISRSLDSIGHDLLSGKRTCDDE